MIESRTTTKPAQPPYTWANLQQTLISGYEPLPDDQSIRMLVLEPGGQDDPLIGAFDVIGIDSPEFGCHEALSYVWGTVTGYHNIVVRSRGIEQAVRVTPHLYEALKRLRLSDKKRSIWIDQVCIDQGNYTERSQQIQFMNRLYKHARHILVWLGSDTESVAESAFNFVLELDKIFQDVKRSEGFHVACTKDLEIQSRKPWVHLDRLMQLGWVRLLRAHIVPSRISLIMLTLLSLPEAG